MPSQLAFPGGALDPADGEGDAAYRRALVREIAEETGLEIPEAQWQDSGERVTPALFPIRFRTRFFVTLLPPESAAPVPATGSTSPSNTERASTASW